MPDLTAEQREEILRIEAEIWSLQKRLGNITKQSHLSNWAADIIAAGTSWCHGLYRRYSRDA